MVARALALPGRTIGDGQPDPIRQVRLAAAVGCPTIAHLPWKPGLTASPNGQRPQRCADVNARHAVVAAYLVSAEPSAGVDVPFRHSQSRLAAARPRRNQATLARSKGATLTASTTTQRVECSKPCVSFRNSRPKLEIQMP